jgi:hypothetical protein
MKQVISPMPIQSRPNKSLQWTHGNVTHFAMREMRAITVRQ